MVRVKKVSLIITSFNSEKYLSNLKKWIYYAADIVEEIIVVDDCSTDDTVTKLKALNIGKLRILSTQSNTGRPAIPRNIGINSAIGDWVVLCDIDDIIIPTYLKFLQQQETDKIYTGTKLNFSNDMNINLNYKINYELRKNISRNILKYKNMITLSGAAIPNKIAKNHVFQNEPLEDWIYWKQISASGVDFVKLTDCPVFYSNEITLSPSKSKQIKRVAQHLGVIGISMYLIYYFRLIIWEKILAKRYFNNFENTH